MRKFYGLLVVLLLLSLNSLSAQTRLVSGKVLSSEDKQPIIGATVMVKGTSAGTITGTTGEFSLSLPESSTILVITYIGMKAVEVEAKPDLVIYLDVETSELEEVMVVAYGTTTKKSFTGSASTISGDKLTKVQSSSISKSLEGAASGVQISSASGQPGSDAAIRIRGLGSISASQAPLIVVDGVPYEGSLNSISAQDVESLNVLKDAAANSMYGARGSNGVILITTKKGRKGETKVSFESRSGVNSRGVPSYDVITDEGDYCELTWEAVRNSLVENGMSYFEANQYASNNLISEYLGYNVFKGVADNELIDPFSGLLNPNAVEKKWTDDWLSEPFQNGIRQEYNINVSGGTDNTSAYMSVGYLNDKGYVVNSDFTRLNTRLNLEQKLNDNFKVGANFSYVNTNTNAPIGSAGGSNYSNMFLFSQSIAPIYPVYAYDLGTGAAILDAKGNKTYDFGSGLIENGVVSTKTRPYGALINPIYTQQEDISENGTDNFSLHGFTEYKFWNDFKFTVNLAYDVFNTTYTSFATPLAGDALDIGYGTKVFQRYAALNANQLLNYTKQFGLHNMNVLVGHESKADDEWYLQGEMKNYWDYYNPEFINAGAVASLTSYTTQYRIEGYLSRFEYSYDDKYYGSFSFRRDGSSKFAPDVRWGNFWSLGGAWRLNEENFMAGNESITNFKLKSSYGTQGNDNLPGNDIYSTFFATERQDDKVGLIKSNRGVLDVTWEKSQNFNFGFEMDVYDRIRFNADFFVKETKDMINRKQLATFLGYPTWEWANQIDMKNTGFEFEVEATLIKSKNTNWNISFNGTTYKNELTRLPEEKDPAGYTEGAYWRKLGGSLYDFYLYEYAGVDAETGLSMWYMDNQNGDKVTTTEYSQADLYETGKSAIPDFYGGLSTTIITHGFDVSVQTAFQLGGYVYDGVYAGLMSGGSAGKNWSKDIYMRWTPANTDSDIPRVLKDDQNTNGMSTRFVISASYFSLRNITIGYTFPQKLVAKYKIQTLRIYVVGDNLWLLSARQGLDPRQSFSGATFSGTYSALRTTSVGLSVNF